MATHALSTLLFFQHHGTVRTTAGAVQGRDWDEDGVGRRRRRQEIRRGRMGGERTDGGERMHIRKDDMK